MKDAALVTWSNVDNGIIIIVLIVVYEIMRAVCCGNQVPSVLFNW